MGKALRGLKVVEWGDFISAAYCAKLLADLGAEVIKVEPPQGGDESRSYGPFPNDEPNLEKSGLFLWLNAGKQGITLNLDARKGKELFRRLAQDADVVVENYRPPAAGKKRLSYASLRKQNPGLILASITPFGRTGPYKDYEGYHINCCAAGGVSIGIGSPDREPLAMPMFQGDFQAGISAASAIMLALLERRRSKKGQAIDISEAEVLATLHTGRHLLTYIFRGVSGLRRGNQGEYFWYPNCVLPCKDGYMALTAPQIEQWTRFVEMMGKPEWTEQSRYRNRRVMHEQYPEEVDNLLLPWLLARTKEEIFQMCREKHVPFAPVYTTADLAEHPHLVGRRFFRETHHPVAGTLKVPGSPFRFCGTSCEAETPAPLLGQHNEEILCGRLGYSRQELTELSRKGVI